jgi:tetratricopeptide (TPR) repeat protein
MRCALARGGVGHLVVALAVLAGAGAARADTTYQEANRAYKTGDYAQAVEHYESLVAAGVVHEYLYYNLGNAHFRAGRLGPAIYNYERALRIDPGLGDARYNLAVAREAVTEKVADRLERAEKDPLWMRAVTFLSIGWLSLVFLLGTALLFGGLIALRLLATGLARTAMLVTTAFVAVGYLATVVLLAGHILFLETVQLGIVLPDRLLMHEAADDRTAERGQVHAGLRVRIVDREPGWVRVRLANGHEGWVPDGAIGEL